jgi:DNA-binding transcriptional LysR family regulator
MELRQLKYFVAAAHALNISRAARHLNISQPAVSRMIRELEAELGVKLFIRKSFGLNLTPSGTVFLDIARKILHDSAEAINVFKSSSPNIAMKLDVGFISIALGSFLGNALREFRELYPHVEVGIHDMSPGDQVIALRSGEIDLAILTNPDGKMIREFDLLEVKEVQLHAVLPGNHRLSREKEVKLEELKQENFIGYDEGKFPGYNQMISSACVSAGFRPALTRKSGSLFELMGMIGAEMGICLMPGDAGALSHAEVVFIALTDAIEPVRFAAAWLPGSKLIALHHLLECMKER